MGSGWERPEQTWLVLAETGPSKASAAGFLGNLPLAKACGTAGGLKGVTHFPTHYAPSAHGRGTLLRGQGTVAVQAEVRQHPAAPTQAPRRSVQIFRRVPGTRQFACATCPALSSSPGEWERQHHGSSNLLSSGGETYAFSSAGPQRNPCGAGKKGNRATSPGSCWWLSPFQNLVTSVMCLAGN